MRARGLLDCAVSRPSEGRRSRRFIDLSPIGDESINDFATGSRFLLEAGSIAEDSAPERDRRSVASQYAQLPPSPKPIEESVRRTKADPGTTIPLQDEELRQSKAESRHHVYRRRLIYQRESDTRL